jgi:D-aspartate ligase
VKTMTQSPLSVDFAAGEIPSSGFTPLAPKTPAVIVGADADGLGIARCLGRAGVPVIVADKDRWRPGMHSRYVRPFVAMAMSGPALIDSLLILRSSLNVTPLLFVTTDLQVRTISEHRHRLAGSFRIRLPERFCVRQLLHKLAFQDLAERHGFPVPRAIRMSDERDFAKFSQIEFPAVIKPGNKELFFSGRAPRAQKVRSRDEAESLCRAILPEAPDLIVQEWVEGEDSDIYFCLQYRGQDGLKVSSFVGRKLRSWPPQTGSTASCTAAPEVESLLDELTTKFFDKTHMVGMCSMEFKKDRYSGKYFMIEPTVGRADWQEEVANVNGVNIPLTAYNYELGFPLPEPRTPRSPRVWIYPPSYFRSILCAQSFRDRRATLTRMKSPCWSLHDPVPSALFVLEWMRKFWSPSRWRDLISERSHVKQ